MKGNEVKAIREKLDLSREEFADFLCLSGYRTMMNIETDFRNPSKFTIKFLRYLDNLSKVKAKTLIEEMNKHDV